jgi:hypothetical protein
VVRLARPVSGASQQKRLVAAELHPVHPERVRWPVDDDEPIEDVSEVEPDSIRAEPDPGRGVAPSEVVEQLIILMGERPRERLEVERSYDVVRLVRHPHDVGPRTSTTPVLGSLGSPRNEGGTAVAAAWGACAP